MNEVLLENPSFTAEAVICCILPREDGQNFTIANRTHGVYYVNHPKNGEAYALSRIPWKKDYADVGDYDPAYTRRSGIDKRKVFTFDAKEIAADICHGINDNGPGEGSFFGVFVCVGQEPTEQELETSKKRLESYFMQTIAAADSQWSSNPRHDLISGIAKRAARHLKLDPEQHEWLISYRPTVDCPVCGERIKPGVAVCKGCHAILDAEEAAKFGIGAEDESVPAPKHRGRPNKTEAIQTT
jgi:hypothetical protein